MFYALQKYFLKSSAIAPLAVSVESYVQLQLLGRKQARSLVVSLLPGNPLLVWEGVGLRIAACASMHVCEHKLAALCARASTNNIVDCVRTY